MELPSLFVRWLTVGAKKRLLEVGAVLVFFAVCGLPLVAVRRGPSRLLCGLLVVASRLRAWALGARPSVVVAAPA